MRSIDRDSSNSSNSRHDQPVLPRDVLASVVFFITDTPTLHDLCLVSKTLRGLTTPHLYRSIHLITPFQIAAFFKSITPSSTSFQTLSESESSIRDRLSMIKHLHAVISTSHGKDPTIFSELTRSNDRPLMDSMKLDTISVFGFGQLVETIPAPIESHNSEPTSNESLPSSIQRHQRTEVVRRYDLAHMFYDLCKSNGAIHSRFKDLTPSKVEAEKMGYSGISPARRVGIMESNTSLEPRSTSSLNLYSKSQPQSQSLSESSTSNSGKQIAMTSTSPTEKRITSGWSRLSSLEMEDFWFPPTWTPISSTSTTDQTYPSSSSFLNIASSSTSSSVYQDIQSKPLSLFSPKTQNTSYKDPLIIQNTSNPDPFPSPYSYPIASSSTSKTSNPTKSQTNKFRLIIPDRALIDGQFESAVAFLGLIIDRSPLPSPSPLLASQMSSSDRTSPTATPVAPVAQEEEISNVTLSIRCFDDKGRRLVKIRDEGRRGRVVDDQGKRVRVVENLDDPSPADPKVWEEWVMRGCKWV